MAFLDLIKKPTLLLDQQKCLTNINRMTAKAARHGLLFRPHFKTHQSRGIGSWFWEQGVRQITVSSLQMAKYFAEAGWQDITVAFPVNLRELDIINELAGKITLNVLVEDREVIKILSKSLKHPVGVFIKIDTGYHRTGIPAEEVAEIDSLVDELINQERVRFKGFLTHAGHTYQAHSREEILNIHRTSSEKLNLLKQRYLNQFPELIVSIGDTPSCSVAEDFSLVDEIRPGNFVFYDVMQWKLGSCTLEDIAVALACPVVAKHPERKELVFYAGAVHLSKEFVPLSNGQNSYGLIVELTDHGWQIPAKLNPLIALSQEHGIARVDEDLFNKTKIGHLLGVLPVHSCLTANLMQGYFDFSGKFYDHLNASFSRIV